MRRITRTLEGQEGETGQLGQLQPGVTLQDRYLILGILGSGGMSSVYKGRDLHFPNVTKLVAVKEPQPEVHIRGDAEVRYESVGRVVVACQRAGILKVGFITEPPAGGVTR